MFATKSSFCEFRLPRATAENRNWKGLNNGNGYPIPSIYQGREHDPTAGFQRDIPAFSLPFLEKMNDTNVICQIDPVRLHEAAFSRLFQTSLASHPRFDVMSWIMNRREFLKGIPIETIIALSAADVFRKGAFAANIDNARTSVTAAAPKDWLTIWEKNILGDTPSRPCDKEMGEELGWIVTPFLNGFYYGYLATHDPKWVEFLIDWTDSCVKRGVKEPDGFLGWPKGDGGGGDSKVYSADSLLGEAMMLRPIVLMAAEILKTPALKTKWGVKARGYLELAGQVFQKWDSRYCWRETPAGGGLWVVPAFGIDLQSGKWSAGYERRQTEGFSNPANKQNHIARWLVAMSDVMKKDVYRTRAEHWFRLMKSRMQTRDRGKYFVWNYWDPAGLWDYKADGSAKHWIGVHPNGGYYQIDVEGIVTAFEHGLVFQREDIDRLIATNRDFMWNQEMRPAKFQRIDGEGTDPRWKNSPGLLWSSLIPYDDTLRRIFIANNNPASWGGMSTTPWFLSLKL